MQIRSVDNFATFSVVRDILLEGGDVTIAVNGQSMLPFFRSGSKVTLRPIKAEDYKKCAVVFADAGGRFVIHRIINIEGQMVTLLGDGNYNGTETMPKDRVYGVIDCSKSHIFFAKIWLWLRPIRRFPLAFFRRVM